MTVALACPVCGLADETATHVHMGCERASKVWLLSPFRFRPETLSTTQFWEIWTRLGSTTDGGQRRELLGLFAFICWYVWRARNDWVFNKKWIGEQDILGHALSEFNEFHSAIAKESKQLRQPTEVERTGWKPPNQGVLKINSDGAFDGSRNRGGVGLVRRMFALKEMRRVLLRCLKG